MADLTERALLGFRDHRGRTGGRDGTGIAPATMRKELAALRVLARKARRPDLALTLELPVHQPPPLETLTEEEYARSLRMPAGAPTPTAAPTPAAVTTPSSWCWARPACATPSYAPSAAAT